MLFKASGLCRTPYYLVAQRMDGIRFWRVHHNILVGTRQKVRRLQYIRDNNKDLWSVSLNRALHPQPKTNWKQKMSTYISHTYGTSQGSDLWCQCKGVFLRYPNHQGLIRYSDTGMQNFKSIRLQMMAMSETRSLESIHVLSNRYHSSIVSEAQMNSARRHYIRSCMHLLMIPLVLR